jgi:DNA-directed RNA polymerase subunit RPC12/RpoP
MSMEADQVRRTLAAENLYQHGREALKGGDRERAKQLLLQAVDYDRDHSEAWLWLSATTDDLEEQKHYLEWAIAADPANTAAVRGLGIVLGKIEASANPQDGFLEYLRRPAVSDEPEEDEPGEDEPVDETDAFRCPRCGGSLEFEPGSNLLRCSHCGYTEALPAEEADDTGQVLAYALPTAEGQRWATGERAFKCSQCGATTVVPPATRSERCPFCGAAALIAAPEDPDLMEPQTLIPMKLDLPKAEAAVAAWLKRGVLIPDDLSVLARDKRLKPVYAPFWLFEASLKAHWKAAGADGGKRQNEREGAHTFLFTHYPQPATRSLPINLVRRIMPYLWKEAVAFAPGYLAGWPAGTYDVSLAEAALLAREGMLASARKRLPSKALPGQKLSEVQVTSGDFSGEIYELILLPLWIGHFEYQKTRYRVLVNGQNGKVAGDRPVDWVKIALILLAIVAAVSPLLILLFLYGLR